jgi:hypothetical protein
MGEMGYPGVIYSYAHWLSAGVSCTITNCDIVDNIGAWAGAGIGTGYTDINIFNCIFWGNTVVSPDYGNSDIECYSGDVDVRNCNVQSGYSAGVNITSEDPLFLGSGDDPYQLSGISACVDAADSSLPFFLSQDFLYKDPIDISSIPNFDSTAADIGAYEYYPDESQSVTLPVKGGYGMDPHGQHEYGNAGSAIEPRYNDSFPVDGANKVSIYDTTIRFSMYCFSSIMQTDTMRVELSEDDGDTYADVFHGGSFVSPFLNQNSFMYWNNGHELVVSIDRGGTWEDNAYMRVRVTGVDEYGNDATKSIPLKWE